jgi:hypothetical protein
MSIPFLRVDYSAADKEWSKRDRSVEYVFKNSTNTKKIMDKLDPKVKKCQCGLNLLVFGFEFPVCVNCSRGEFLLERHVQYKREIRCETRRHKSF